MVLKSISNLTAAIHNTQSIHDTDMCWECSLESTQTEVCETFATQSKSPSILGRLL